MAGTEYKNGHIEVTFDQPISSMLRPGDEHLYRVMLTLEWKQTIAINMIAAMAQGKPPTITNERCHELAATNEMWLQRMLPGIRIKFVPTD